MGESLSKVEFFNRYFELLEERSIPGVILHTYENYPEEIHSDVDYCVSDRDLEKIVPLVHEHCRESGWRLVQVMQHEVRAFFCICVSRSEPGTYVELDVCSDYMREGRVLICADLLLEGRRACDGKSFWVPPVGTEFCYSLWKSAAKKKSTESMLAKLDQLYARDPDACEASMRQQGLAGGSNWGADRLEIYKDLRGRYEGLPVASRLGQFMRVLRRVTRPSGLFVTPAEGAVVDARLIDPVRCAFRKVLTNEDAAGLRTMVVDVLRSTLVFGDSVGIASKLLGLASPLVGAGLRSRQTDPALVVEEINYFLERRLCKRWGLDRQ